jgi:hypothetical protein
VARTLWSLQDIIQVLQSLLDPTGVRAHDQPYSRRTRLPLHQSIDAVICIHDVCKQDTFRYKSIWTLDRLNAICETRRAHQIQYRRLCKILDEAFNFDIISLRTSALYFISNFTREVFKTEGFLSLTYTSLNFILFSDLSMCETHKSDSPCIWYLMAACSNPILLAFVILVMFV